jgi:hypothetical protein
MSRHIRNRRRAGFTLIEMLLAAGFTAAACTAATMLIQSISQADSASRDRYAGVAAARDAISCVGMLVEEAALVGYWDDSRVLLWRNDDNGDGQINLAEMTLVCYDTASQELSLLDVPVSGLQNRSVPLSQFVAITGANDVHDSANGRTRRMIVGLQAFQAMCDDTAGRAQQVQVTFSVGAGEDAQAVHAVMTLRNRTRETVP